MGCCLCRCTDRYIRFYSLRTDCFGTVHNVLLKELATIEKWKVDFHAGLSLNSTWPRCVPRIWRTPRNCSFKHLIIDLLSFTLLRAKEPAVEIRRGLSPLPTGTTYLHHSVRQRTALDHLVHFCNDLSSDSMAYLFGRFFGKRPLAPTLVKKTIEGWSEE